jgi:hypothetical protein
MSQASQHQNRAATPVPFQNAFDGLYVHSYRARAAM